MPFACFFFFLSIYILMFVAAKSTTDAIDQLPRLNATRGNTGVLFLLAFLHATCDLHILDIFICEDWFNV